MNNQLNLKAHAPIADLPDAYPCRHGGILSSKVFTPGDTQHSILETGGVANGEQLLRIGSRSSVAAHLCWRREIYFETPIRGFTMTATATCRRCLGGVQHVDVAVRHSTHLKFLPIENQ